MKVTYVPKTSNLQRSNMFLLLALGLLKFEYFGTISQVCLQFHGPKTKRSSTPTSRPSRSLTASSNTHIKLWFILGPYLGLK